MKFLFVFFLFLGSNSTPETKSLIKLDRNYKVESTFSGNASDDESFHLIIAKNIKNKQVEIIPISNIEGNLNQLPSIAFDEMPSVSSFHNSDGILSLVVSTKNKKDKEFTVIDINLVTGKNSKSDPISGENYKTTIRKDNKNLMVFVDKKSLKIIELLNAKNIKTINVDVDKKYFNFLKELDENTLDAINTDEFVANGSINKFRVYSDKETLFITKEDKKNGHTTVSKISLIEKDSPNFETNIYSSGKKTKKTTSYIHGSNLYQLKTNKDLGEVDVFDLSNNEKIKKLDLRSIKRIKYSKGFSDMDDFLKRASKGTFEPTITVNETHSGNLSLRFDYVLKNMYSYRYNWWWHHHWMMQQQMMWQQQQMRMTVPRSFGPSEPVDNMPIIFETHHYFEFIINDTIEVLDFKNETTVFDYIDKKKCIDEVDENTKIKHTSTVFLKDEMRYFGYNKSSKSFKVLTRSIDD